MHPLPGHSGPLNALLASGGIAVSVPPPIPRPGGGRKVPAGGSDPPRPPGQTNRTGLFRVGPRLRPHADFRRRPAGGGVSNDRTGRHGPQTMDGPDCGSNVPSAVRRNVDSPRNPALASLRLGVPNRSPQRLDNVPLAAPDTRNHRPGLPDLAMAQTQPVRPRPPPPLPKNRNPPHRNQGIVGRATDEEER